MNEIANSKPSLTLSNHSQGWTIAAICLLAQFFGNGMVAIYGVFLLPIAAEFDAGMSAMSLGMVIYILVTCLMSPIIGSLIKPGRIKPIMLRGTAMMAASMLVLATANSLPILAAAMVLLSVSFSLYGAIPCNVIITQWYDQRRGRALAIMAMGISIAGFTLPPIGAWLLETVGWRTALMALGLCGAIILFSCIYFWLEEKNEETSQENINQPLEKTRADCSQYMVPTHQLLRQRNFWLVGLAFGIINTTLILSGIYLIPYLQSLGLSAIKSASIVAVGGITGLAGKILIGWLADSLRNRAIVLLVALEASLVFCWYMLLATPNYSLVVFLALAVLGMAQGGTIPLQPYINSRLFGAAQVGRVTGLHALFLLPFVLPAVPILGHYIDASKSYTTLFFACGVLIVLALLLSIGTRRQTHPVAATH